MLFPFLKALVLHREAIREYGTAIEPISAAALQMGNFLCENTYNIGAVFSYDNRQHIAVVDMPYFVIISVVFTRN